VTPRDDLPVSDALSIVRNGPDSFKGRKVGVLVSDGCDGSLVEALGAALAKEGAMMEIIAPKVGGVEAADGSMIEGKQMIDGGPSVLYDTVALIVSPEGAERLMKEAAVRDFIADAFAHCKFIAHVEAAQPLLDKAGVEPDEGVIPLGSAKDFDAFVKACRKLRLWAREQKVKI
jgi:catalase